MSRYISWKDVWEMVEEAQEICPPGHEGYPGANLEITLREVYGVDLQDQRYVQLLIVGATQMSFMLTMTLASERVCADLGLSQEQRAGVAYFVARSSAEIVNVASRRLPAVVRHGWRPARRMEADSVDLGHLKWSSVRPTAAQNRRLEEFYARTGSDFSPRLAAWFDQSKAAYRDAPETGFHAFMCLVALAVINDLVVYHTAKKPELVEASKLLVDVITAVWFSVLPEDYRAIALSD